MIGISRELAGKKSYKMGRFEPIHDAHAIEQVALVLQTLRTLDDADLAAVAKAVEQFKVDLPIAMQLQTVAFGFGAMGVTPPRLPPPSLGGTVLSKLGATGMPEAELRLERAAITFRTTAYTRWADVWGQARRYFQAVLPIYAPAGEIAAIALNYVDKFYWDGDPAEASPKALLREGSAYVSPYIFETADLWHNHVGAFRRVSDLVKRLVNINLDCQDEDQPTKRRVVSITTVLTDWLGQPGYGALQVNDAGVRFFCERADELHTDSKAIVCEILNDQACQRIGLNEK